MHVLNKGNEPLTVTLSRAGAPIEVLGPIAASTDATKAKALAPGSYDIRCDPSATRLVLIVSTKKHAVIDPSRVRAVTNYRAFVTRSVAHMVPYVAALAQAINAGQLSAAQSVYPASRVAWEEIEPVAETFGDLDPRMNARVVDIAAGQSWGGWHRIEKGLWATKSTAGLAPVVAQLQRDVTELQGKIAGATLTPASIANGALELIDGILTRKITGEEEIYSHTDFVDIGASIEGAYQAFLALKPVITKPTLISTLNARFKDAFFALKPYARGSDFVAYTGVSDLQRAAFAKKMRALIGPLRELATNLG